MIAVRWLFKALTALNATHGISSFEKKANIGNKERTSGINEIARRDLDDLVANHLR